VLVPAILVIAIALAGCGRGGDAKPVTLDGTPRWPDDEGVVTRISRDLTSLTLDRTRTFAIDRRLQSFSTVDGSTLPLRGRLGQYVQVGVRHRKVVWLAAFASVVRERGERPVVYYAGVLVRTDRRHAVFADGTVLALAPGVAAPRPVGVDRRRRIPVLATIDPARHAAVALAVQSP
jgi:hypothetical protein